ncbi:MAG: transglutaminase domain-containing protein [Pseudomonadota bacterium]
MSKSPTAVWFAALVLLGGVAHAEDDQGLYLHIMDITASPAGAGEQPTLRLVLEGAEEIANEMSAEGFEVLRFDADSIVLDPTLAVQDAESRAADWRDASFIVDYLEPSVQEMIDSQPWSKQSRLPEISDLSASVFDWISDKTYAHGFDFASTTARSKAGDCTEHALLLAAVARSTGRSARVVFGLLLIDLDEPQAFGHAWTEIWTESGWRVVDATEPQRELAPEQLRYVPLGVIDNEGPGYGIGMLKLGLRFPKRIEWSRATQPAMN